MKRTLRIRKERLAELTGSDLDSVRGGQNSVVCLTVCTSCASDFQECATGNCLTSLRCTATQAPNC